MTINVLLWILSIYIAFLPGSSCYCNICQCKYTFDLIDCSHKNLSVIPEDEVYPEVSHTFKFHRVKTLMRIMKGKMLSKIC